jgi:thioesterase domain-containing protein
MLPILRRPFSVSKSSPALALDDNNRKVDDVPEEILAKIRLNAWRNYQFLQLKSRAVLFRTQESGLEYLYRIHADLGWGDCFDHGLQIVEVPGDHFTLLKDPHALTLALRIKECLEELSPRLQQPRKISPSHKENQPTPFVG